MYPSFVVINWFMWRNKMYTIYKAQKRPDSSQLFGLKEVKIN